MNSWTPAEKKFLKSLSTPERIQQYVDSLVYNSVDDSISPRYVIMTHDGHCLEGGLLACAALELQGHPPLMVSLQAENDDHHVITVYRGKLGWGAISKSNTALLRGRDPVYKNIRELVMSYFDFYFNVKGEKALYAYSEPINLNHYNDWNWRTSDDNLVGLGLAFNDVVHYELLDMRSLKKLPRASKRIMDACFFGADEAGLYRP